MPIRPLSKELQEVAEKELNEVPSRVKADLDHIREWISQQPHLKARTDDQWLIVFLRSSKFSLQRAKEKIDLFYTMKSVASEYSNRDPFSPEIQEVLRQGISLPLLKTSHASAPRICIQRGYKLDPEKITLMTYFKVVQMITEILMLEDDNFVVTGVSAIFDLKNFPYSYISQVTPDFCKRLISYSQDVYPMRVKMMACLNAPASVVAVYNMVKMLFTEKFRSRVFFLKDEKNINNIPVSVLPKDYGGNDISSDEIAAYWKTKVESYRDWFLEDAQYGVDESKRPGKPKMADSGAPFGAEGSFIKLEID